MRMPKLDWTNLEQVTAFATKMANEYNVSMAVIRRVGRDNYNITHLHRTTASDLALVQIIRPS